MNDSRHVRLVLVSPAGELVGSLPGFDVSMPWWPEVQEIVEVARTRFGVELVVLRILVTNAVPGEMGGDVTYVAEIVGDPAPGAVIEPVEAVTGLADHPLRMPWARPGGVAATIAWADRALQAIGRPRTGKAVQVKTWNLSSILRLPTADGDVWCKSVPPFCAHESAIIELVGAVNPSVVPPLLASDLATSSTSLLAEVTGEDQWETQEDRLIEMVRILVRLQSRFASRVHDLRAAGLPDWRADAFPRLVHELLSRSEVASRLDEAERTALGELAAGLNDRLNELAECGVPETLVHGDFHPGNWRANGRELVLLDWGDSGIGSPMLDMSAFLPRVPPSARAAVRSAWFEAWATERPGCDAERAMQLVGPIAALRSAIVYQGFLDRIEPSERPYHDADVPLALRHAIAAGVEASSER